VRALVQRVAHARVTVAGRAVAAIERGLLVLVGATHDDGEAEAEWLARKVAGLRIFADAAGQMNRDLSAVGGRALVVPQFTLYGDARGGRRPEFLAAARPEQAEPLFVRFCEAMAAAGVAVERGVFGAHMEVLLLNDGPVTLLLESPPRALGDPVADTAPAGAA